MPPTLPHGPQEVYAIQLYEALEALSTQETIAKTKLKVFRGSVTKVYAGLGIPQSHYGYIKRLLEHNECLEWIQRGARDRPTVIVLYGMKRTRLKHPPPASKKSSDKPLTDTDEFARLESRVKRLEELVGEIHLPTTLAELAERLDGRDGSNGAQ